MASASPASLLFYKVYHLDKSGNIKGTALVQAWTDEDALQKAADLGMDHEIEVWDRTRFVGMAGVATGMSPGEMSQVSSEVLAASV